MKKPSKKIIIFDFDDTLFETAKFKSEIQKIFAKYGIAADLFEKTYQLSKNDKNYWQPKKQLDLLTKGITPIKKRRILDEINLLFKKSKDFLYSDTILVLRKLSFGCRKHNLKVILLTYGNPVVQRAKIKNCRLAKFFDKIIIAKTPAKKKELSKIITQTDQDEKVILIEDRGSIIDPLKKQSRGLIAIHIQRITSRYREKSLLADFRISNLMEIEKIIKKL